MDSQTQEVALNYNSTTTNTMGVTMIIIAGRIGSSSLDELIALTPEGISPEIDDLKRGMDVALNMAREILYSDEEGVPA